MRLDRRRFVATCSAAALGGASGVERAAAGTPSDLVGTWRVVSYEDRPDGGKPEYPYGERPIGQLVYDASGHMAVQITKTPTPAARARKRRPATPGGETPEPAYTAYFGTYTVDWERRIITHAVEGNLYPIFVGTTHERPFTLDGDRLTLEPRWEQNGKTVRGVRVFERLR